MRLKLKSNPLVRKLDRILGVTLLFFFSIFKRKKENLAGEFKKILLIRFAAMGDTVLLIPAIRSIRKKNPEAEIDFFASNINYDVINLCPYIDYKYRFEFSKKIDKLIKNFYLIKMLRKNKYDLIIDFEPFVRLTALISYFLKGNFTIGYNTENQYKHLIFDSYVNHSNDKHEIDNFFSLVSLINCNNFDKHLELWTTSESERKVIDKLNSLNNKEKLIVIHPSTGGVNHPRQWPEEYFIELIKYLKTRVECNIVLIGSKSEKEVSNVIMKHLANEVYDFTGETNLYETIELIKRANLFISGNTGTMHIASAFDIPLIALHGPTNPLRFGPLGKNSYVIKSQIHCSPCLNLGFEYGCDKYPCMKLITPNDVIKFINLNNIL